jgi:peroxiredoxin Q/BCP
MEVNDLVENFTLQNQDGETVSLEQFAGKPVVLFFYPKADTPGCTIEACEFRDATKQLQAEGAVVLGISRDTPKAQKKFQEKFHLGYPLLADVDSVVCKQFDVLREKNMYGKKVMGIERTTFVIGPDRRVMHIFRKVKPEGHAEEVLQWLREHGKRNHVH